MTAMLSITCIDRRIAIDLKVESKSTFVQICTKNNPQILSGANLLLPWDRGEAKNLKIILPQGINYLTLNFIVIYGAFPNF
ncbi:MULTISPECIES: hypothetical protein [unclassified Microcoleus]|uniref:hypothetical protein n=1 Tax=unclassified Microcoleus TaxID=2642155 RepID=UPI002FD41C92